MTMTASSTVQSKPPLQPLRIVNHDYGAFAFPVQLSRELARRGHEVIHLYSDFEPHGGRLEKTSDDPKTFSAEAVSIGESFQKYSFRKRMMQELKYRQKLLARIEAFKPSIVFSSNTPILVANFLERALHSRGIRYVHWTQDIHTLAIRQVLPKKFGVLGSLGANYLHGLEKNAINRADAAIVISDDFKTALGKLDITPKQTYTIPNWMPLDEMKPEAKVNPWSIRHSLDKTLNIMYVGTMSFKHDHQIFVELAKSFKDNPQVRVVVVGAGIAWDNLMAVKQEQKLDNLVLLGWQKYEEIAYVFAAGDILMSAIAPDASQYSVPSKVLSYLSVARPVLAAIPAHNLVRQLLHQHNMGLATEPEDIPGFIVAAKKLVASPELRETMSKNGRAYAEYTFDIRRIGDQFETIMQSVL
jgi:glycosyltransferase involved in cell wall biosynthesis